jgi:hypothetical protein
VELRRAFIEVKLQIQTLKVNPSGKSAWRGDPEEEGYHGSRTGGHGFQKNKPQSCLGQQSTRSS